MSRDFLGINFATGSGEKRAAEGSGVLRARVCARNKNTLLSGAAAPVRVVRAHAVERDERLVQLRAAVAEDAPAVCCVVVADGCVCEQVCGLG